MESNNTNTISNTTSPATTTVAGSLAPGTPASRSGEVVSAGEKKRVASTPELLIFYTNTDESNYPIYITQTREVFIKRRPASDIAATFVLKSVQKTEIELTHPLLETARKAIQEVSKAEVGEEVKAELLYEVYRGDMEVFLGEANAYYIRVSSKETPFSGLKHEKSKAWAVGFDWARRISAKYPMLNGYCYVKGEEGNKGRAYVHVTVKLPIPTPEFVKLFNKALAVASIEERQLDEQIEELKKLISEKEKELAELKAKLEELLKQKEVPGRIASMVSAAMQKYPTTQIQTEVKKKRIACPTCDGSGGIADPNSPAWKFKYITCPRCKGSGWIEVNEQ
jgi:hypothetical protein